MQRQVINAVDAGEGDLEVRSLREKMAAEPDNLAVRLLLASHYSSLGYPELALEHYRLAAARFPDDAEVQVRLARTLRSLDMNFEALAGIEDYLFSPGSPLPAHSLATLQSLGGILLDEQGRFADAEPAFRAAVLAEPDADSAHNNLGYNLLLQGKAADAAGEFRRALKLSPHSEIARNNLGIAIAVSDSKEAVLNLQSVSDPATAHSNLAAVLIELGKYPEARQELALALGFQRDHAAALRNLKLVSDLDGGSPALPAKPAANADSSNLWKQFAQRLRKLLLNDSEAAHTRVAAVSK